MYRESDWELLQRALEESRNESCILQDHLNDNRSNGMKKLLAIKGSGTLRSIFGMDKEGERLWTMPTPDYDIGRKYESE